MRDEIARGQQAGVAARDRAPAARRAGTGAGTDPADPGRRGAVGRRGGPRPDSTRRPRPWAWRPASTTCCCRPCGRSGCGGPSVTAMSCRNRWPPRPSAPGSTGAARSPRRRPGRVRSCWPADPAICTPSAWNQRRCCCAIRAGRAGCSAPGHRPSRSRPRRGPPPVAGVVVVSHLATGRLRAVESIRTVHELGIEVFYAGNAFTSPRSRRGVPGTLPRRRHQRRLHPADRRPWRRTGPRARRLGPVDLDTRRRLIR